MKFLLFVKFNTGLMHNAIHKKLEHVLGSVKQLMKNDDLDIENEDLPSISELKERLNKDDDFCGYLSNGTWFHIQPQNIFEIVK